MTSYKVSPWLCVSHACGRNENLVTIGTEPHVQATRVHYTLTSSVSPLVLFCGILLVTEKDTLLKSTSHDCKFICPLVFLLIFDSAAIFGVANKFEVAIALVDQSLYKQTSLSLITRVYFYDT